MCACQKPNSKNVPTVLKPNSQTDEVSLDLSTIGIAEDSFPIEKYAPIAVLGQGARADAILARDRQFGKKVVVKCFKTIKPDSFAAFDQDVRKNKQLTHTNIARILEHGIHNNKTPYIVTEYKDGFNLEQYLAIHGTPSYDVTVKILISLCEVLLYAQKESLLHRNVKPGNIIFLDDMNSEPSILITDFGMPKIKEKEDLLEARDALYMSSEEARNMAYDERSEVYSIGCVGFALLAGRPPFQEGTARDIKNSHALKLPPRISRLNFEEARPKDLEEVVEKCLEKDPKERFESVAKLNERLAVFPRREQLQINAVLSAKRKKKLLRMAAIVSVLLLVFAIIAIFVFKGH